MAKKFSFRLEPVLNLRAFKAKQAKEALAEVMNLRYLKERELDDKNEYFESLNIKKVKSANASELQAQANHRIYIQNEIKKLKYEKKQLIEIEDIKRIDLTEKMKGEKIMEKLKEKKKTVYIKEEIAEETKRLDEISTNKFYRH